jgi:hypothetical protein
MHAEESAVVNEPAPAAAEVAAFVRRALGLQFEMRFEWEAQWWPVGAQEVAETLLGYYDSMHSCLEQMREGKELPPGLSYFRVRR